MNITSVHYIVEEGTNISITAVIDGITMSVPLDPANRHYASIVEATAYDDSIWGESVPEPMATEASEWLFSKQLQDYAKAFERLAQYQVALGREEVTEMQDTEEQQVDDEGMLIFDEEGNPVYVQQEVVVLSAIEPLEPTVEITEIDKETMQSVTETVRNPLIVKDEEERAAAQAVIDATPQAVKDWSN